jgi:hypothetical protein
VVIGNNGQVYNLVHYSNGYTSTWQSLGGVAQTGVYFYRVYGPKDFAIRTTGSDYHPWCKHFNGSWSGWYRC